MSKLLIILLLLVSCGHKSSDDDTNSSPNYVPTTSSNYVSPLQNLLNNTLTWSKTCNITACYGDSETGDSLLWNGLLCQSGYTPSCNAVKAAQDSNGRFYRSEFKNPGPNSFSRDMALGVLLYLAKTQDRDSAKSWLSYIRSVSGKLCTDDTDGRCLVTVNLWGLMYNVWSYIGLEPSPEMKVAGIFSDITLALEANTTPLGYQLHLVGVSLLIRNMTGKESLSAENILVFRQSENPFFRYLVEGHSNTVADKVLEVCPQNRPADPSDWAWQRDTAQMAWQNSMGWDCVFMAKELLK